MFIVLLGAPGSGKGTVAQILEQKLDLAHISTGDLFRENLKNETELGKKVKEYMDKGELVPDEITIEMLEERLRKDDAKNGAILDGFPRTKKQAEELDRILDKDGNKVDMALNLDVPFEEIIERIANRRNCTNCNAIYNVKFNPPKEEGMCDNCGGKLYQRDDQKPEIVKTRLEVYEKTAEELLSYYGKTGKLYSVKAGEAAKKGSNEVADEVVKLLK